MRRLAAFLLLVAALPAPDAAADPRQDAPFAVQANGAETATLFATVAGKPYSVTVRGVYAHDGTHVADCGHANEGDAAGSTRYVPVTNLYVDGSPASCSGMAVTLDHGYRWTVTGTGGPLRFRLVAPPGAAGALAVAVSGHALSATCDFTVSGLPSSLNVLVSIQATATADGASDTAVTSVRCAVRNSYGEEIVAEGLLPGPKAAFVAEGILRSSTLVRCLSASATWASDLDTVTYEDCP